MDSQLEKKLAAIEDRLSQIEKKININQKIELSSDANPRQGLTHSTHSTVEIHSHLKEELKEKSSLQTGNWLGIIAVVCFVLAAGFIIKLSIDSGWLTHSKQVGLAVLVGISLIITGLSILKYDREYTSYLPASGIIILYLSIYSAHAVYYLISFPLALLFTALISGLCIFLYNKIQHDFYAFIAAVGAYVSPSLTWVLQPTSFIIYYYIICSLAFTFISIWMRSRTLTMVSAYLAILMTSYAGLNLHQHAMIVFILSLHFIIFSLGTFFYTIRTNEFLTEDEAWAFFPVLLLFYAMEYYFISLISSHLAPWCSLLFAGFLIFLYIQTRSLSPSVKLHSQGIIIAFTTIVLFHSVYLELLPHDIRPWLFSFIILGLAFCPENFLFNPSLSKIFKIPFVAIMIMVVTEYLNMFFHLVTNYKFIWFLPSLMGFASIWALLMLKRDYFAEKEDLNYLVLTAAHALAISGLYQLTTHYGSLAVSATWLFYAIVVVCVAIKRHDIIVAKSALFIFLFAAAKTLLYDASSAPTLIRILCLLLTGAVLYGAGFFFKQIDEWKNVENKNKHT